MWKYVTFLQWCNQLWQFGGRMHPRKLKLEARSTSVASVLIKPPCRSCRWNTCRVSMVLGNFHLYLGLPVMLPPPPTPNFLKSINSTEEETRQEPPVTLSLSIKHGMKNKKHVLYCCCLLNAVKLNAVQSIQTE